MDVMVGVGPIPDGKTAKDRQQILLLQLRRSEEEGVEGPLAVRYDGATYSAAEDSGLTKSAVSIATQLLGLHRESEELPKTEAVSILGGS